MTDTCNSLTCVTTGQTRGEENDQRRKPDSNDTPLPPQGGVGGELYSPLRNIFYFERGIGILGMLMLLYRYNGVGDISTVVEFPCERGGGGWYIPVEIHAGLLYDDDLEILDRVERGLNVIEDCHG